ncbi:50S ribosomal protein L32 [candidate division TM6 bacterium RIFCSPHIGHO2_12_FULL_38_8]|nr:MAG: 50S ribosomal protein L32 [candidate division TM6 bacterium RIFCSPHIGHO2_12_FULL_38_8]
MPCPKRKSSKQRRNKRHANKSLDIVTFTTCPNSGVPVMPHTVCAESGYYKGVKIFETKTERAERRKLKRDTAQARRTASMQNTDSGKNQPEA